MCYGHSKDHVTKICYGHTSKILTKKICCENLIDPVTKYTLYAMDSPKTHHKRYDTVTPRPCHKKCYEHPKNYARKICYGQLTDPNCHKRLLWSPQRPCHKNAMDTPKTLSLTLTVTKDCYEHSKDHVSQDMLLIRQTLSQKIFYMYGHPKVLVTKDMLLTV